MRLVTAIAKGLGRTIFVSALALSISLGAAADKKSVAIFPTGTSESVLSPEGINLESSASSAVEKVLRGDERLQAIIFTRANASVRRALSEGTIPAAMLMPPFTGKSGAEFRAVVLGRLMRAQTAVASIVSSYRFARDTKTAHVVLTIEAYDVATGKILGVASLSAQAQGDDEKAAAAGAIEQAATSAAAEAIEFLVRPQKDGG